MRQASGLPMCDAGVLAAHRQPPVDFEDAPKPVALLLALAASRFSVAPRRLAARPGRVPRDVVGDEACGDSRGAWVMAVS